ELDAHPFEPNSAGRRAEDAVAELGGLLRTDLAFIAGLGSARFDAERNPIHGQDVREADSAAKAKPGVNLERPARPEVVYRPALVPDLAVQCQFRNGPADTDGKRQPLSEEPH